MRPLRTSSAGHTLTVSPDEQTIVYTYTAASGTDLMLVEGFR